MNDNINPTQENSEQNSNQNKIEHFSISLPKGGGAIRGIEEKFQANAVTGSGNFSVPLPITPGRGGFSPQLSLAYDSGGGNSEFGLGWNVGLPSITRKTNKTLPTYEDYKESDVFILSGAEDLVPVLEKTKRVVREIDGYTVYPYRPRIEGLFARIERWTDKNTHETYWKATTKENITSVYGKDASSKINDPKDENRVFQWLLQESFDAKGNRVIYNYKKENNENIEQQAYEANRRGNNFPNAKRYLKSVKYNPGVEDQEKFHLQLLFDYGEHSTNTPEEMEAWPRRQDPFSTFNAGFEQRTYRLCTRVLMFHNFSENTGDDWQLVRSLELSHQENPFNTYLSSLLQKGWQRKNDGSYRTKSLPVLELKYSQAKPGQEIKHPDKSSLENLPVGLDNQSYQWVDIEGEGLPGIVSMQGDAICYKENLGSGKFGKTRTLSSLPETLSMGTGLQLTDIDGDGNQELLVRNETMQGYFPYEDGEWKNFTTFEKQLTIDWNDPNLKTIDLNGDGHADILITQGELFRWYPSKAKEGYEESKTSPVALDVETGPRLVFADPEQSIYLSDMSGDGLTDIVRIRNGAVCYWPNLGHGRFGAKVTMANAPTYENIERELNQQYIKLGDIDGSGTTDIFYFGNGKVQYWLNQSGNAFSQAKEVPVFLPVDSLSTVNLIDLTGKGTLSLVWSTSRPGMEELQLSYIDLMGEKPHLLTEINNNMGKLTRMHYVSSVKFYLEDKAKGMPWVTKLPFPVHVLEKVVHSDLIGGSELVTRYEYHHGYYDGVEREFRGFGRVETIDTETHETYRDNPLLHEHYVAPIRTKTWFHTGAYYNKEKIARQYEHEYYAGDENAFLIPDTQIENKETLDYDELREACRALKNSALRQEIYEDGTSVPYQVSESGFVVKTLQHKEENRHGVFFVHPSETLTYQYEQDKNDPRLAHQFTLDVDAYGNILQQAQVVYPRRLATGTNIKQEQLKAYTTLTENSFINVTADFYLLGIPCEVKNYELNNLPVKAEEKLSLEQVRTFVESALENKLRYDEEFTGAAMQARLFDHTKNLFWNQAQDAPLPLSEITEKALLHHSEMAALTPQLLEEVFGNSITDEQVALAGYKKDDGYWWNPGLVQHYGKGNFYLPDKTEDPFGATITVKYDSFYAIPVETADALGNTVLAKPDYRTLQPWQMIDPNGNKSEAVTDALGLVIASSVYGSEMGQAKGDSPIFNNDGTPYYQVQENASIDNILANPETYLQEATTYFYYDPEAWMQRQQPPQSIMLAREKHVRDLQVGEKSRIQRNMAYSDGFGRELQSKVKVEPGKAWVKQADKSFKEEHVENRWLASGRTVYNNKEKPIKQYEPFYTATPYYEQEQFFAEYGVSPVVHYDPLLREVQVDTPKGFFSKVEFTPWEIQRFDENDTVPDSEYYQKYNVLPANEKEALDKAAEHYNTPAISLLDTLGREFMNIQLLQPLSQEAGLAQDENQLITYSEFNITGQPVTVIDPRQYSLGQVKTFQYTYDMAEQPLRSLNIDAGNDRVLNNTLGNPILAIDSRGHTISTQYDILQRPVQIHVSGNGLDNTTERIIYGETLADAKERNIRGQIYLHYDQAGLNQMEQYSFKGEPLLLNKQIRTEYKTEAHWNGGANQNSLLEPEIFVTRTLTDALGRVTEQTNPDGSLTVPEYHPSGHLNKMKVRLKGETALTEFVSSISYNPKGQREEITYGNNTRTLHSYETETFRLLQLQTRRLDDGKLLQNINYSYDAVGNIVKINDLSHDKVFNNNQVVEPEHKYIYDALYRLQEATGRGHTGLNNPDYYKSAGNFKQSAFIHTENTNDANKLANYTRKYHYDKAGNLGQIKHIAANSSRSFTRGIAVDINTNRAILKENNQPVNFANHFDVNGNCTGMEHLRQINWNYRDNIASAVLIERQGETNDAEYYTYDAQGNRVRKVSERIINGNQLEVEEKIYLGSAEIKRRKIQQTKTFERSSLHIMDDQQRIAIAHNWQQDDHQHEIENSTWLHTNRTRYQYGNHLGSASLELDTTGQLISYEEYFPFGGTSFMAGTNQKEVKLKDYRYNGKERDDVTGLYYYGARYYAPWIGRFMSFDPLSSKYQGISPYAYCKNNPINLIDPDGLEPRWGQLANLSEILEAVQVGLNNFQGVAPKFHWSTRAFNTQQDLNRWSQQSIVRQQFNTLATHFSGNRQFRYDHSTGDFNEISAPNANVDRYIYTEKQGWIDMQHFFTFASYAIYDADEIPNATFASYGSEAIQDYIMDNASGFSYEDLVSNEMGFEFGLQYGDAIVAGDITIQDALKQYLNSIGAVDPEQAPNFEFIPYAPTNENRNTKFDNKPLIGNELRNAARNVYNLKDGDIDAQGMSAQEKIDKAHEQIDR